MRGLGCVCCVCNGLAGVTADGAGVAGEREASTRGDGESETPESRLASERAELGAVSDSPVS